MIFKTRLISIGLMLVFIIITQALSAQTSQQVAAFEDVLEQLSTNAEEELNLSNQLEELAERLQEPFNINTVSKEQLEYFPFLSSKQIENILAYIYIHGPMQTIYELQLVENMDVQTIRLLQPFVYAGPVKEKKSIRIKDVFRYGAHEVLTRLDLPFYKRKAYTVTDIEKRENRYLGTPQHHSMRYGFRYRDNIYAGVTAEKDAGEPFFGLHNKQGYDHYSFYIYLRNIGKLKTLALGNYRVSFGQGLVISQDFLIGKTSSLSTLSFRNNAIRKHSSADEYNYLRGLAGSYQLGDFTLSAFYSHRSMDGTIEGDTIVSIQKNGLHRTTREAERRNAFTLQAAGGNVTWQKNNIKLRVTGMYYCFSRPYYANTLDRKYARYNLRGKAFYNLGVDYRLRWNRLVLSGEVALDKKSSVAMMNALNYTVSGNYKLMLIHRYYAHDYWAFFARSFSEGGYVQNENGWYLAAEATPFGKWKFFASVDLFAFPWWKYRVDKPSQGMDALLQTTYTTSNKLNVFLRYRFKKKERNYTPDKTVKPLYQHKTRGQIRYALTGNLSFRTTIDYTRVKSSGVAAAHGFQAVQSFAWQFSFVPVLLELHGAWFRTDDYDSRVYSYEKGLLYSFNTPSFYGEGTRFTANVRWNINRNMLLIAKLGTTLYNDRDVIGSSWDEIKGSRKTDLQLQFRAKF